jgi:hypothetical protein
VPGGIAAGASTSRGVCARIAIFSLIVVSLWTAAEVRYAFGGNRTALFNTGSLFPMPPDLEAGTYRFNGAGYDGQYYRYLAHDPALRRGYFRYVDAPQMRFRRILIPLAAWLLAFGHPAWVDPAYIAVELLVVGLGVYWCSRFLARRGCSPLWGLLFVAVPATLASLDRMLVDGPLAALFAGFVLYCEERRWSRVWLLAMLAALTRDTGLLLAAALVTDRLWRRDWLRAAWFGLSAAPAAAWYGFIALRLPPDRPIPILAIPVWGLLRRLFWLRPYPDPAVQLLLRVTDAFAVLGLAASIVLALRWLLQRDWGPVPLCVGFFAVLALVLGTPAHMTDAFGFARPVSPLLLWVMLEAASGKARWCLIPPLLVSLSVLLTFTRPFLAVVGGL